MRRAGLALPILLALCARLPAWGQEIVLENEFLRVAVSPETAALTQIVNKTTEETFALEEVPFTIATDSAALTAGKTAKASPPAEGTLSFAFEDGDFTVDVRYALPAKQRFLQKWLTVRNRANKDFAVKEVVLEDMKLDPALGNAAKYYSYAGRGGLTPGRRGCPTALFLRSREGGFCLGIENPFFLMEAGKEGIRLSYRPMLRLKGNEEYTTEKEFIGVYRKTERFFVKQLPTLSGWTPDRFDGVWESMSHDILDWGEIWAMQEYMRTYMPPTFDSFRVMMDGWWAQLPSLPDKPSRADVDFTRRMAANLREVGVNLMSLMLFPKEPARLPDLASTGWEVNANVEEVIQKEQANGMRFGLYLGDSSAMAPYGNSGARDFLPEKEDWKKRDRDGRALKVNCLGCDEFAEWFFKVQDSTIRRYDLGWWQWDGGIGSWDVCFAENHRHLPGESPYAEWRARMEMIRRLKEAHPNLWVHIYWGLKPYGPWGLKWVDTHENYYEMGEPGLFPTIWSDQWMADDGRQQFWWNQNCRFLPHYKNYAQVGHAARGPGVEGSAAEIEQGEFWEENRWKYALLSVIGTSGCAVINTFPNDLRALRSEDFVAFYRKWLAWANENYGYLKVSRGIFGPPEIGVVDGYSHILRDRGFLFFFNPNLRDIDVALPLSDEILLTEGKEFVLTELYPQEGINLIGDNVGVFRRGSTVTVTVPAENALVLAVKPYDGKLPMLFGMPGKVQQVGEELVITGVTGEEGATAQLLVLADEPQKIRRVRIDDQEARFGVTREGYIRCVLEFEGIRIVREMENWEVEKVGRIELPNPQPLQDVRLETKFFLPGKVKDILAARRPLPRPSGKPTPLTADASRLLVSIPLTFPDAIQAVEVKLNDHSVPVYQAGIGRFVDITDWVVYDRGNVMEIRIPELLPGQFLGPYIENIPIQYTDRFKVLTEWARTAVRIGPPPQKTFWDATALGEVQQQMKRTAQTRAKVLSAYHRAHEKKGVRCRIEFATKDRPDEEWGSENLLDGDTGVKGGSWRVVSDGAAEVIFGFEEERARVAGLRVFNNSEHPPAGMAKDFAVYVSDDKKARKNPRHPSWRLVHRGGLEPRNDSFQEFRFPAVEATYLHLQVTSGYGGDTVGLGEVEFVFE